MSRKKGKNSGLSKVQAAKFDTVDNVENFEQKGHLTPRSIGTIGGMPVYEDADVPVGQWVAIPKGMRMVEGCYVDAQGIMRFEVNNAPAVWHHSSNCKYHQPPCKRRITNVADIVYDDNNAPWCPDCIGWQAQDNKIKETEQKLADTQTVADYHAAIAKGIAEKPKNLNEAISRVIGDFQEAEELGTRQQPVDYRDVSRVTANANPLFANPQRGPQYYPSGRRRSW